MKDPNIAILETVVENLQELASQMVFIGGATVGLYIVDKAVPSVRHTIDIDCVVEVISKSEYYELSQKLRAKGFQEDQSSEVICRFRKGELILDVIPTSAEILNFSNPWYPDGIKHKVPTKLSSGAEISIFSVPFFLASKIVAFSGRGEGDFMSSHDIEDIVTVFDGDPSIAQKIVEAPISVSEFLTKELGSLLANEDFISSVEGHINDRLNTGKRTAIVLERMKRSISKS